MIQTFEDLCTYAYVTVDELFPASVLPMTTVRVPARPLVTVRSSP
jgi:hypothetical protein